MRPKMNAKNDKLLDALGQYGYPLLEPELKADPNQLLAKLAESKDTRLLEGFPVVLANAALQKPSKFSTEKVVKSLKTPANRRLFRQLFKLSLNLYDLYHFEYPERKRQRYAEDLELKSALQGNKPLKLERVELDLGRVKKVFLDYVVNKKALQEVRSADKLKLREEFKQEY